MWGLRLEDVPDSTTGKPLTCNRQPVTGLNNHCHRRRNHDICSVRFNRERRRLTFKFDFMSQHRSLRAAAKLGGKRNVLKRFERTELLKKRGQWKEGDRITGLRKTKPEA